MPSSNIIPGWYVCIGDARTRRFVYSEKLLNKEYLGDARTMRFVYTVKSLNKEHLEDERTSIAL